MTLIGLVAAWILPADAQQRERAHVVGVIMIYAEGDPEGQERLSALREQLRRLGWAENDKIRIEVRWAAGKADRMHAYATELVGLPADVMVVTSTPVLAPTQSRSCLPRSPIRSVAALLAAMLGRVEPLRVFPILTLLSPENGWRSSKRPRHL